MASGGETCPGEAMLTLADPEPVLRDVWPDLSPGDDDGRPRIGRLVDQRLRDENGFVKISAVEPVIELLFEDDTSWRSDEYARDLLRAWLRAHVDADTPSGHPLRILFRQHLVDACADANQRLTNKQRAEAAALAARTPEEKERDRQISERNRVLFEEIGYGGRRRRPRPEVPYEITDQHFLELLALVGPDLGEDGEAILRRVAQDAPWALCPALERPFTAHALARSRRGFLAELTEAYYLDDEPSGHGAWEDGIRRHCPQSISEIFTHAVWHRGPFMMLMRTDFRNGVAVLNRLLNHAALIRARTLSTPDHMVPPAQGDPADAYLADLEITGERRRYVGDAHVWVWYRGTGVGPYPCMSALQALERMCDWLIAAGTPVGTVISILLEGCENLATVGLAVGILTRHLEQTDRLLDPYLAEPLVWQREFSRVASEMGGLGANSEGLVEPERQRWTLREAAGLLVLTADDERADELRAIGEALVANARQQVESTRGETLDAEADLDESEQHLATVRSWAVTLDRDRYHATEASDGYYHIQATPPDEVVEALQPGQEDIQRSQQETRLNVRYHINLGTGRPDPVEPDELADDIAVARDLLDDPPLSAFDPWDTPALVAAAALEAHLAHDASLPDEALAFAAEILLRIGEGVTSAHEYEFDMTYFQQGADRSAARALPLLLLPQAAKLRSIVDQADGSAAFERAVTAVGNLARATANEVRLHLARGLDCLWQTPCAETGRCPHHIGLRLATDTMRYCVLGPWTPDTHRRRVAALEEPTVEALGSIADDSILVDRLDAAIRALASAVIADICISTQARTLLDALLDAQRRALLAHEDNLDHRGTHTLVAARALLTLAQRGDHDPTYAQIDAYANNSLRLDGLLRALSAAAEETPERAAAAWRIWPSLMLRVLELNDSDHNPFQDPHYGDRALADLVPNAIPDVEFLYREIQHEPIRWWKPIELLSEVEAWLPHAAGNPECVDQLVGFIDALPPEDQARTGLLRMATLVLANPTRIAKRSYLLSSWLTDVRPAAGQASLYGVWQQIVDALVVAGVTRLAPYSE